MTETCPQCGKPFPSDAPAGICPACLMKAGLEPSDSDVVDQATVLSNPGNDADSDDPSFLPTIVPGTSPTQKTTSVGDRIRYFGDYELVEEIARGGMGVVYKATQTKLNRVVALKMILSGQLASEQDVRRFYSEAEAAANLDHPGIVPIYEVGEHEGQHYFSMAFVEGPSLSAAIANGPLPPKEAAQIVKAVTEAMAYAHDRGVIHRDLKPANILLAKVEDNRPTAVYLTAEGIEPGWYEAKVTDFGLAKKTEGDSQLTGTGQILGTPSYMPPEQAGGKTEETGPLADVYSLGAILYCLLTGRPPFQSANVMDTLIQVLEKDPVPVRQLSPNVPVDLETICQKCLEKPTEKRYASANDLGQELDRFLEGRPIVARPVGVFERGWRWCHRNRALGLSIMSGLLTLLVGVVVSTYFGVQATWNAKEARSAQRQAEDSANSEAKARKKAEDLAKSEADARVKAEFVSYAYQIDAARQRARQNDFVEARAILAGTEPQFRNWEYDFVYGQTMPIVEMRGHTKTVNSVCFSPDGKRIASGSSDKNVKVWDAATGAMVHTLHGHTHIILNVSFSPDGKRIVSGSTDKTVKVWDADTGTELLTLQAHKGSVYSVKCSPDGKRIVSGSNDKTVKVWDAVTGVETLTLSGHTDAVHSVSFSPDSKLIVSGAGPHNPGKSGEIRVWDAVMGTEILTLKGGSIPSVSFSPDGKRIVSGSTDKTVKVWDTVTGAEVLTLNGHTGMVLSVSFSPDGTQIISGAGPYNSGKPGEIKVWDAMMGTEILTIIGHTSRINSVSFSPDGKRIVSGSDDKTLKVWEVAEVDAEAFTFKGHTSIVTSVSISPDSKWILSGSDDKTLKVWDTMTEAEILTLQGHTSYVKSVKFSPDGKRIVSGGWDRTVKVWDADTSAEPLTLRGHTNIVNGVSFSPDGKRIVSGSADKTVKVWDAVSGAETLTLNGHTRDVNSVCFSPDGKRIVSGGRDGNLKVWDADTGTEIFTLQGHTNQVTSVSFSPNGKRIVSGSLDKTMKVWDAVTGKEVHTLNGHTSYILSVSFSPDSQRIVSGSTDGTVKVWDIVTGAEALTLQGLGFVTSVCFSFDGKQIVSGGGEDDKTGVVKVWDAATGK